MKMPFNDEDNDYDQTELNIPLRTQYEGEDRSPTTPRELSGWYAYPIAAEVFAVVAVGAFIPVILEQLARENGHFPDKQPCINRAGKLRMRGDDAEDGAQQCVVDFLGRAMTTSSFAMYTSSAAVLVQAVTLVCLSSFADHGPYRKKMLMGFTYTGSVASALFIFVTPAVYFLAPLLVIVGVTSLGCSFVLLNAFLPLLVANHPKDSKTEALPDDVELDALHPETAHSHTQNSDSHQLHHDLKRSAQISSKGVGYGYIAAVLFQFLSVFILWLFKNTTIQRHQPSLPIRIILLLVGLWWAIASMPTLLLLRPRPGPPLPSQHNHTSKFQSSRFSNVLFYTSFSLRSFWHTLLRATRLRQTLRFLTAWFLLSDAVATISGTAVLFARTELHMGTIAIALLSITSIGCGIVGAFTWPRVQKRFSLQPKTVLIYCIGGLEIIPLYGLLGFVPVFKRWGYIGLQQPWEIYIIAVIHGVVMGGISSYARAVYAPLIPEGSEAAFFALYAVTDKGSSAFGPALVGWIVDRAGSIRPAFVFLAVLVVLPAPLMWLLDVDKGREDAKALAGPARGTYERLDDGHTSD